MISGLFFSLVKVFDCLSGLCRISLLMIWVVSFIVFGFVVFLCLMMWSFWFVKKVSFEFLIVLLLWWCRVVRLSEGKGLLDS